MSAPTVEPRGHARAQTWSVVVLCYNEVGTIRQVISDVKAVMHELAPGEHEIIVVDDGSTDGSREALCDLQGVMRDIKTLFHASNLGIGRALLSGYRAAAKENVCMVPGDGQFDVRELLPLGAIPERTFISFYRTRDASYSVFRNGLSYLNRQLNHLALGIALRDVNWVKVYKTAELRQLRLRLTSSLVESEICAKLIRNDSRVVEIRSAHRPRTHGRSKGASLKTVFRAAKETLSLILEVRRSARGPLARRQGTVKD